MTEYKKPDPKSSQIEYDYLYQNMSMNYEQRLYSKTFNNATNETDLISPSLLTTVCVALDLGFVPLLDPVNSRHYLLRRQDYETTIEFIRGLL